ncbi:MAG: hypothetical protein GX159_05985 [Flavobacteriaceae bacterium]|jgi:hypothetical protein|nr:hypothetical protein [Flavobacteriaceae bacterium]
MKTFSVKIPDDKTSFFLEFLELIGGSFEKQEFELTSEQKEFLLRQNKVPLDECISAQESYERLKTKHGL